MDQRDAKLMRHRGDYIRTRAYSGAKVSETVQEATAAQDLVGNSAGSILVNEEPVRV